MNTRVTPKVPALRCAIYTRKSSEEGLEQGFNSLDAQYDACTAYVASQRHEGWRLLPERYDDGGLSGGTLERPGLQRLLAEVEAGRVSMIVVYKIDRLTRSLADFARLVERLESRACSFVSVTQAFNTSSSMGRLTLNVLLSFAQFEREVTAERIRDKIAASKRKGLWMGGSLPLGYDPPKDPLKARVLEVNPTEADTVRRLFALYLETGTLTATRTAAQRWGLSPRKADHWNGAGGMAGMSETAGKHKIAPFSNGQLHYLLTNPVYRGMTRHKAAVYPGQHAAIIDVEAWDAVQTHLQASAARKRHRPDPVGALGDIDPSRPIDHDAHTGEPSAPLTGKIFDETGDRLTPSHTNRHNRRFRYYVSRRLITKGADATGWRLPAPPFEALVLSALRAHLTERAARHDLLAAPEAASASIVASALGQMVAQTATSDLWPIVGAVHLRPGVIRICLAETHLATRLALIPEQFNPTSITFEQPFTARRRGVETRLASGTLVPTPDPVLQRNLAQAHRWAIALRKGESLTNIARAEQKSESYIRTRLNLAFLAPRIQRAIFDGTLPAQWSTDRILRLKLPDDWSVQIQMLGL